MLHFEAYAWPLIFLLVLAGLLTWFSYRRTEPKLSGASRWGLPGLRGAALTLLLFLLFEPVLQRTLRQERPPVLAVLIDESQSMSRQELLESLPAIDGDVRFFGFGRDLHPLDNLRAATNSAPRTNISGALRSVQTLLRNENLGSVLLVSDGQHNTGISPVYVAADYNIPIHTLVVGDTTQQQDLMIARTATNEFAYVGQTVPVDVTLLLRGYQDETTTTNLYTQDSLLSTQTLVLPEGESTASLRFVPQKEGLFQYTVTTTELENEASVKNNRSAFTVRVLKKSQKICLIAAAPHPDVTAIRNILARNEGREIDSFVQMQPGQFYEGPLPDALDEYDAIVLVGFPGNEVDEASLNAVVRVAETGTPLLFLLTRQTDLVRLRRAFANVLPALPTEGIMMYDEASLRPTETGFRDPLLSFPETLWDRLPPLIATTGHWEVAPDSRVLAQAHIRGINLQEPLLVIRSRAGYRTASVLGGGTWRWLNLADDPADVPRIWPDLVENLIQWLTTPEDDRTVRVEPASVSFDGSEPIDFSGQVYDESLNPVPDAVVTLELTAPDGAQYPYTMANRGSGLFALRIEALPEGVYTYAAQAMRMNASLGIDNGTFTVGSLGLEQRVTRSDGALLRQIAYRSGGQFFADASLTELPDVLASDSLFAASPLVQVRKLDLSHIPWMLGLLVLLLSAEWIIRKRNGLA